MTDPKNLKTCKNGHSYYKNSNCPTCPVCEQARRPQEGFLSLLSAPARRAMESKGILTLEQLSEFNESELLKLHGLGPGSIPILRSALEAQGLSFRI
jgi:hypothetical protein